MKKAIISFLFILSISFIPCPAFAKTTPNIRTEIKLTAKKTATTPQPQSNAIKWRYKRKKGKLYKRLYNYTRKKWIGKWIRV